MKSQGLPEWLTVCKCCGAVVPKARSDAGPGYHCSQCDGHSVA